MRKAIFAASVALGTMALSLNLQAQPAHAGSLTGKAFQVVLEGNDNLGSDRIKVQVDIEDIGDNLKLTLSVLEETIFGTNNIADLRGFFFDVSDESILPNLSVIEIGGRSLISGIRKDANNVLSVGSRNTSANIDGNGTTGFDAGFAIGKNGIGEGDDIRSLIFELSATGSNLGLELLNRQRIGIRATSTGVEGGTREGSSKVVGEVPTPALLPGLVGMGVAAMRKRKKGELVEQEA